MRHSIFKKIAAYILVAVMVSAYMPTFPASNSKVVKAEEAGAQNNQDGSSTNGLEYGKDNNLTDSQYKSLGFNLDNMKEPAAFDQEDTSNPLEGMTPTILSELYMGTVNRDATDDDYKGHFYVMNNAKGSDSKNLNVETMKKDLIGSAQSYSFGDTMTQCVNVIAVNPEKPVDQKSMCAKQVIVQTRLYTGIHHRPVLPKQRSDSYQDFVVYSIDENNNYITGDTLQYKLSDDERLDKLTVSEQYGQTAMAVGDYDNDGYDEIAAYVGKDDNHQVKILDLVNNGNGKYSLKEISSISLSSALNGPFETYDECAFVTVDLDTTSMSGQDDLVVNVSMPYDRDRKFNYPGALGVFRFDSATKKMNRLFFDQLNNNSVQEDEKIKGARYKLQSATNADLNGDGQDEIVVSGYMQYKTNYGKEVGEVSNDYLYVNVLLYKDGQYYLGFDNKFTRIKKHSVLKPNLKEVGSQSENSNLVMTAGRYKEGQKADTVFIGGGLYDFTLGSVKDGNTDPNAAIAAGRFTKTDEVKYEDNYGFFIGNAITGVFDESNTAVEQTVYIFGNNDYNGDHVDLHIGWVTEEKAEEKSDTLSGDKKPTTKLTSFITNKSYFSYANEDDNGTCLTMCALNVDQDTIYMKYRGKHVGWSDPTVLGVMLAPPYWGELDYGSLPTARGNTSFSITENHSDSTSTTIKDTLRLTGSITAGMSALGLVSSKFRATLALAFDNTNTFSESHATGSTYTFTQSSGTNSVALMVTPLVTYNYDTFVPEHIANEAEVARNPELKVGQVVPGQMGIVSSVVPLDPAYATVSLDTYNSIANAYNSGLTSKNQVKLATIDTDKIYGADFDPADPSTFVSEISKVQDAGADATQLVSSDVAVTSIAGGTESISLTESDTSGTNYSFSLVGNLGFSVDTQIEVIAAGGYSLGADIGLGLGYAMGSQDTNGKSYNASLVGLPTAQIKEADPSAYAYNVKMAKWEPECLATGDGTRSIPVVGYLVTGTGAAPAKIPSDLKIAASGVNKQVLSWTNPKAESVTADRLKNSGYKLFSSTDGNSFVDTGLNIGANDTRAVVTGLQENTTYYYRLQAITNNNGTSVKSALGNVVSGKTKSKETKLIKTAPSNCYSSVGSVPEFSLEAEPVEEGDTLSYQWQKFAKAGTGYAWSDINADAAKADTFNPAYALPDGKLTADSGLDQTTYRCKVVKTTAQRVSVVDYSRAVTLFIGESGIDLKDIELDLELSSETPLYTSSDGEDAMVVEVAQDEDVDISVIASKETSEPIAEHEIMIGLENDETGIKQKGYVTDKDGVVATSLADVLGEDAEPGTYKLVAYSKVTDAYKFGCSTIGTVIVLKKSKITCDPGEGSLRGDGVYEVTTASGMVDLEVPHREGYTFEGWYSDEEYTKKIAQERLDASSVEDNMTLYAKWSAPIEYTITYELNGGPEEYNQNQKSYTVEDSVSLIAPKRNGYLFEGWFKDEALTQPAAYITRGTTGNQKFYAKWQEEQYTIIYVLDGGDNATGNPVNYNISSEDIVLQPAEKEHCMFEGWYSDSNFETKCDKIETGSYGNKVLYAKWAGKEYKVSYECNGGTNSANNAKSYCTKDGMIGLYPASKKGYTFDGWYADNALNVRVYALTGSLFEDDQEEITLYAKWIENTYGICYNYRYGEPENYKTDSYTISDGEMNVIAITRQGYTFDGWYLDAKLQKKVDKITLDLFENTKDIDLYAKWKPGCEKHTMETKTKPATVSANGSIQNVCKYCDYKETATVIAKPTTFTLSKTVYTYDEKEHKPTVTIKDSNGKEIATSNYTLKYSGNGLKVKKYTVTVTFKGNYSGTKELQFKTVPKSTSIKKVKAGKKKLTVTWKKQSKHIDGYQIRYRVKGTDKWMYKTITNKKATKCTIKKLKSGKKYELNIKTYKTSLDEKLGTWSKTVVKKVK